MLVVHFRICAILKSDFFYLCWGGAGEERRKRDACAQVMYVEVKEQLARPGSVSTILDPEIKLRLSGLVASTLTC